MGRSYAGVLGLVAFLTVAARGLVHVEGTESTLLTATLSMAAFAAVGAAVGQLAAWLVLDSVRSRVAAEAAAQQAAKAPRG